MYFKMGNPLIDYLGIESVIFGISVIYYVTNVTLILDINEDNGMRGVHLCFIMFEQ